MTAQRGRIAGAVLTLALLAGASLSGHTLAHAQTATAAAQRVADHFSGVKSMKGNFVQFDAAGNQTEGTFFMERPGKIRFDYSGSPVRVIADGSQVAVNNRKLNTWDLYPLSKTPLKLLLDQRIDLSAANIQSVKEGPDLTTIVMGDKSIFGNSRITMMFDPSTMDLRQWTIRDAQGKDTTVMVYNVVEGGAVDDKLFNIPYANIRGGMTGNR
ncbi:outer-membrane lipoprotein carrier protein LolA [Aureimonas phyllosphaerae]|uniref:Outer membrane lipoprotein-sorting protein n=1 Tax=Aureimonas phyllosphaerae TaxID=1166078 RepID=A0A7W6FUB4_9HYPH|nr:outer-membrane lipoprotein carrier protein LolA [Aureimonas phyllosphaerae]MBB3936029.1 outer membrane lipoprotein-sorting protein [Aureimonas phyllosphaerae]MBB3960246.1 outer membrane lipoprotein-sorting protein [Aureimonas phyllosphaerae]SFF35488.1 Outer membrane lipoprotein-sorting protein [Aureimonas phyllosphaerae]